MLLRHLDGLFALAQVISSSPNEAARLVERVFRRALAADAEFASPDEERVWLFHQLMQVRREQHAVDEGGSEGPEKGEASDLALAEFRRRLASQIVDRVLPAAFAALPPEHRLILMLCDVQHLSCTEAGRVLDLDDQTACARLEEAGMSLHRTVLAAVSEPERRVLETGLASVWRQAALQRMVESELVAAPPTLAPALAAIDAGRTGHRSSDPAAPTASTASSSYAAPTASAAPSVEDEGPTRSFSLGKRLIAAVVIIAVAGLLGYGFSNLMQRQPNRNLISLSASQAAGVEASFQTASPEQAERYVLDRLGLRVTVPTINQAVLEGVSIRDVADGAEVPVLVYRNASETPIVIYVYSYAFLDRHQRRLNIGEDILRQIEQEGNFDLHDLGEEKALVWRRRDDILVAITSDDAEELRRRITYPS